MNYRQDGQEKSLARYRCLVCLFPRANKNFGRQGQLLKAGMNVLSLGVLARPQGGAGPTGM